MAVTPLSGSGGFLYALYSESMNRHAPDASSIIHKVGYTTRDISIRMKEFERGMVPGIVRLLLLIRVHSDVRSCESHVLDRLKEYNVKGGGAKENFECSLAVIYDAFNSYPHIEWHVNHLIGKSGPTRVRPVHATTRRAAAPASGCSRSSLSTEPMDASRGHAVRSVASYLGATAGVHMSTKEFEINIRDILKNSEGRSETYILRTVGSSGASKSPRGILGLFGSAGIRLSPDCAIQVASVREMWDTIDDLYTLAKKYKELDKSRGWLILHSLKYLIKKRDSVATAVAPSSTAL